MTRKKNNTRAHPAPAPPPPPHPQPNNSNNRQAGIWFRQFHPFVYDPTAGLLSNFTRLAAQRNWGPKLRRRRWTECQEEEFGHAFGTDTNKLAAWQELCREVGIVEEEVPGSIRGCRTVLGSPKVLVNLVNLIDHRNLGVEVIRFKSFAQFRAFTVPNHIFPKNKAKEEGFIRALLRKVLYVGV
ncbi:hypothetical protein L13192_10070 [Pyrenophora tritici-repentis]|nr:hypothetical protein L13192_10070 [Pyrenophora tritici-repentis]KAI1679414.1 hypothetical protein KJE20_11596 [Pyrenophora tritici-repentis]